MEEIENQIIDLIAGQSNAFFKSQQRNEEDLSQDDKKLIVKELLHSNRLLFLQRYGKYLENCYFDYFLNGDDADIAIYIDKLRSRQTSNQKIVRNRRYKAMNELLEKGFYFSDSEMQSRNPYLFEQLVGQYMSEKERQDMQISNYQNNYNHTGFSSFLMEQIRTIHLKCQYVLQKNDAENGQDDDSDLIKTKVTPEEKELLKKEFVDQMMQDFLNGKDGDFFDYNEIDNNDNYDLNEEFDRDIEDKYFDQD